jgi:ubiquinol-cytochrome c reductase cytochrome b subunit
MRQHALRRTRRAVVGAQLRWVDERHAAAGAARAFLRRVMPDHWSFLLGWVAVFSLVVVVLSGLFLTFFYAPSVRPVVYDGPYDPLRGQEVSAAFDSVMRLSFEVPAGLLMRQIHHWSALVFIAAIVVHLARVFFTGAFRRPRELNYLLGFGLLTLALVGGVTGYSLPDDLLSGMSMRIIYSGSLSIPVIGPWLTYLIFGGEYPTADMLNRYYTVHVVLLPAVLLGGLVVHLALAYLHKPAQFRGPGRTERNVVGKRLWPAQTFTLAALFLLTSAVLAGLAGLAQINPVWTYGPANPFTVTAPAQPDWYTGWLDGALRLGPPIDITVFGFVTSEVFIPGLAIPGLLMTLAAAWPWIEPRLTRDRGVEHHLLDRPRDAPYRTATGVAGLLAFAIPFLAGGNDVIAVVLGLRLEHVTRALQIGFFAAPALAWLVTFRICRRLQASEAHPADPQPGLRLRRNARGGYETTPIADPHPTSPRPRPPGTGNRPGFRRDEPDG